MKKVKHATYRQILDKIIIVIVIVLFIYEKKNE